MTATKDLRGTWPQALGSLALSVMLILAIRWALFEPYVIPSGSMIPTLLVHDHIFVNKFAYGIRLPFTSSYVVRFGVPKRGEILVFRSVESADFFLIKRLVGLPGDHVVVHGDGSVAINGTRLPLREMPESDVGFLLRSWLEADRQDYISSYAFESEKLDASEHPVIRHKPVTDGEDREFVVPPNELFMMGDNRDNSADSRFWGFLPIDRVLGRASVIWLSCDELLPNSQICDPKTLRWPRLFTAIR